jgi:predicted nuclease of restriction endonuclease-like (RecB) superfamily
MSKKKPPAKITSVSKAFPGYDAILAGIVSVLDQARRTAARTVNTVMTVAYWEVGRQIVEGEQRGKARADYGERLLEHLSADLTSRFGRGFSPDNLEIMRRFYQQFPVENISETPSRKLLGAEISETVSRKSASHNQTLNMSEVARRFPLPWSHYVRLLKVGKTEAREFYESEAFRNGWTVRQLDRQISTLFYERTLASRDKASMLKKGAAARPGEALSPEEEIKDPFLLEFLGLKDEYSESDLEEALIHQLEAFLQELGGDFAFVGRQKRLRIGDEWYRVDLVFFHRKLRCLVIIDLKLGKFTHADAGQMHLYLNYASEHWTNQGENPPVGVILCAEKDHTLARYALDALPNKVLAAEYRTKLPDEATLAAELERTRRQLEARTLPKRKGDKP